MKKLFLIAFMSLFTSASADYVLFETRGIDMAQVKERKVLFVGGYREYQKNLQEIQQNIAAHGALGLTQGLSSTSAALANGMFGQALNGAATGMGIGLLIAGVEYWKAENAVELRFVQVEALTMNDGSSKIFQKTLVNQAGLIMTVEEASSIFNK